MVLSVKWGRKEKGEGRCCKDRRRDSEEQKQNFSGALALLGFHVAQWYLISPFCVTSVRSDIFERLAWTSVMYRQSSFDLKNHLTVWLFKFQIVNRPSSSLWIVFSLLFFKIKMNKTPWKNLPYQICTSFSLTPTKSGLPCQITTRQWKLSETFSFSCTRPMCVRQKGLTCL